MPPQRLSVRERQKLEMQDKVLLAQPLRNDLGLLGAYTRQVLRLLRGRSASPATEVVAFMAATFERSIAALTPPSSLAMLACRSGCSYCCAQPVVVTAIEVFALAALIRDREGAAAPVAAAAEKVQGRSLQGSWPRCPLLDDNKCSVYALRPLSCRGYVSFDVQDCIRTFVMRDKPSSLGPATFNEVPQLCRTVLVAALKLRGMPSGHYELNAALTRALASDDSESLWRQGEDVFAGMAPMPVDAELDAQLVRFAESLAPTL